MKSQPLVSVLTPSFNQGRWLRQNLESVGAQTHGSIEHIVMDGGSSDETLEILGAAQDVRWTSEPDRGQSHALNKAYAESSGEIIGWLNADDAYLTRDTVATAVAALDAHPDVAVVYGHAALVDSSDRLLHFLWVPRYSRSLLWRYNYIFQPSAFIRRSSLDALLVDEAYDSWMDRELWLRLAERQRFQRVNEVLAIDRHHGMRKSYRRDLADADRRKLVARYGRSVGLNEGLDQQTFRLITRLAGTSLLFDTSTEANLNVAFDGRLNLLLRQVTMRRGSRRRRSLLNGSRSGG